MKKIIKTLAMILVLIMSSIVHISVLADNNSTTYLNVVNSIIEQYGLYEMTNEFQIKGLIYGEFIDFDNNGTDELMLIYQDKKETSFRYATIVVYAYNNENNLIKVFDKGIYSYLGQTDAGYSISLKEDKGLTSLLVNSDDISIDNGDVETITIFSMSNGQAISHEYYAEVLPWWDTYEFEYTKCLIDGNVVSTKEYQDNINKFNFGADGVREIVIVDSSYDDEYFSYCSKNKILQLIEQAKIKSMIVSTQITGAISERYTQDGVQCLILTLDTPQSFSAIDMFGEPFTSSVISELQISAKNYESSMDNSRVKILSYDSIFEGHTAYHIRPLVMENVVIEVIDKGISVILDGKTISFDQKPIILDGRTLVPLRAIFEELGATVNWDGTTQTVTSTKGNTTISMSIGKKEMYKNGELITLDVVPQLVGGRTLVPVRAVAEGFNCKVDWDGDNQTVIITTIDTEKVISVAKSLYETNEKLGGVTNLAEYAKVDALLYNTMNDIDVTIGYNDFTLDMVSAGTTATIAAAKASMGNYSSINNLGDGIKMLLTSSDIADAADGVLKDAVKQRITSKIVSSVPDINTFVLGLGQDAYDNNSKMILDLINVHTKFKNNTHTYEDAVAYIVLYDTLIMNRKTMSMAVQVLSDELPDNFLESLTMSAEASAKSILGSLFGDVFSGRNISVKLELFTDIVTAYTEYACGESHDFFKYMKQINHPAITEWANEVETYQQNLAEKLNTK